MFDDPVPDAVRLSNEALNVACEMPEVASRYAGARPEPGFELESYPEMTLFRLERWATIEFGGAVRLLEHPETAPPVRYDSVLRL